MARHRLLIVGAGRIGAGFNWHDDSYTHAGAAQALKDRVELVGFVEPDIERAVAAKRKWEVPVYENVIIGIRALSPDVVSVCVQPGDQDQVMKFIGDFDDTVKGVWCEKPHVSRFIPQFVQVNYLRRADTLHRRIATEEPCGLLTVYGKNDIHTRCHFEDLAKWWKADLEYRVYDGPCAYVYTQKETRFFDKGGVDAAECMKGMLGNLLDVMELKPKLWSPPR